MNRLTGYSMRFHNEWLEHRNDEDQRLQQRIDSERFEPVEWRPELFEAWLQESDNNEDQQRQAAATKAGADLWGQRDREVNLGGILSQADRAQS